MPSYLVRHKKTGKLVEEIYLSINEIDKWENENPDFEIAIGKPLIHSGRGMKKPEQGFRDLLTKIKKNNPGSNINDF